MDLNQYSQSAAQPGLAVETIAKNYVPVPPLTEQNQIASFLNENLAQSNIILKKIDDSINFLREYRTALISAAVTGKIDVRKGIAI
jgi:type I restriction enzyme S subunit